MLRQPHGALYASPDNKGTHVRLAAGTSIRGEGIATPRLHDVPRSYIPLAPATQVRLYSVGRRHAEFSYTVSSYFCWHDGLLGSRVWTSIYVPLQAPENISSVSPFGMTVERRVGQRSDPLTLVSGVPMCNLD